MNRRERREESKKKRPALFGDAVYEDHLPVYELEEMSNPMECGICGSMPHFRDSKNHMLVCSDEAMMQSERRPARMIFSEAKRGICAGQPVCLGFEPMA